MENLLIIGVILFLLLILSFVWPPDSPWAPWWSTSKEKSRKICKLAKIKPEDLIYDLGSGNGTALIIAAKEFGAHGVGIEIDPLRAFVSRFLIKHNGLENKINIKRKNFFKEDISNADAVFLYLVPKTLESLIPKFKRELRKGTKIVSYKYQMSLNLVDKKEDLYLYTI